MIVASPLSPLENALAWLLRHLHDSVGLSWGWSIVALTVIVRVILVPLMVRQIHSMQRMQAHMPEMKAIQQKYKSDRQRLNEELMKFYKENQINPAASCLPLVFQLPVFLALYFVLKNFTKHICPADQVCTAKLSWLIVPDITHKITSGWPGWVLLVLYVASQIGYAYFGTPPNIPRSQRIMFMVLPIVFVPVITRFPIGLLMYWMTTNLWTVGQGVITRRMVPTPTPPARRSSRTPAKETEPEPARAEQPKVAAGAARPGPPRRVKRKKRKGGGRR